MVHIMDMYMNVIQLLQFGHMKQTHYTAGRPANRKSGWAGQTETDTFQDVGVGGGQKCKM